jgi:hypothetical protein
MSTLRVTGTVIRQIADLVVAEVAAASVQAVLLALSLMLLSTALPEMVMLMVLGVDRPV